MGGRRLPEVLAIVGVLAEVLDLASALLRLLEEDARQAGAVPGTGEGLDLGERVAERYRRTPRPTLQQRPQAIRQGDQARA